MRLLLLLSIVVALMIRSSAAHGAETPTTRPQQLPDPFRFADGRRVASVEDWKQRRTELLEVILEHQYGKLPPPPKNVAATMLISHRNRQLMATHKQFKVTCDMGDGKQPIAFVVDLLYPPGAGAGGSAGAGDGDGEKKFPVILRGDLCWVKTPDLVTRQILDRGYILAEFNRCEFAPDRTPDAVGLFAAYPDHEFGAVAAWAWGYHRAVDFLLTQPEVDAGKIAITGHSRGGKAVLLAGATDDRIALTAPNNSGTGGAAPYRFQSDEGEPLRDITKNFPTWLTPKLKEYAGREDELPFDQHSLKAVIAPRALLTTEALGDLHANPSGTWLTHRAAREVYSFLGAAEEIAIHFRAGGHEHNAEDFSTMLDFADVVFFEKQPATKREWNANQFPELPPAYSWKAPTTQPH